MSSPYQHCFDPPSRVHWEDVLIDGPVRAGLIPVVAGSVDGHWSNIDVYLWAPTAVFAAGNTLTVFCKIGPVRHPVAVIDLGAVTLTEVGGGQTRALAAMVRGHPCDGFEVELAVAVAATVDVFCEMWGTESVPDVGGEVLGDAMSGGRFPQRASHGLVWDDAGGVWVRARGTASGALTVEATPTPSTDTNFDSIADTTSSTTLAVGNPARLGLSIVNNSSAILWILCSESLPAANDQYTAMLMPGAMWECPVRYTGSVLGIWSEDTSTGLALVTEYV